jgi:hypothetical protein
MSKEEPTEFRLISGHLANLYLRTFESARIIRIVVVVILFLLVTEASLRMSPEPRSTDAEIRIEFQLYSNKMQSSNLLLWLVLSITRHS